MTSPNPAADHSDIEFEVHDEFDAAFDIGQIEEGEKIYHDLNTRRCRRLLLLIMTKDSKSLFKMCEADPDTFFEVFEAASEYLSGTGISCIS